jgi:hypothetical protein
MRLVFATISPAFALSRSVTLLAFRPALRLLSFDPGVRELGRCVACGDLVRPSDAFLRYRGEYYHAGMCIELDPPALRTRGELAGRGRR